MTEFKYGNKKLSTADKTIEDNVRRHPRLKKSYSECEYYDNEGNFNLPSKDAPEIHQSRVKQTSINDITALQYNYDTLKKSQYLLQQQQKLKEYRNDANFLTNGDNYSSESSTETRGILKNSGKSSTAATASEPCNKNSLKRNKGLSTLSLCSCDAETEVTMVYSICFYTLILHLPPYPILFFTMRQFPSEEKRFSRHWLGWIWVCRKEVAFVITKSIMKWDY